MTETPRVTVYQAEWCPYSSIVRQKLTELELPYLAIPVAPDPADRDELRRVSGTDSIPVVVLDDGTVLADDAADIVEELGRRFPDGPYGDAHRRAAAAHA